MSLVLYHSLLNLSTRMLDALNVYAQPAVSAFALTCSLINTFILSNKRLKGVTYKHLFADSIASSVYGVTNSFTFIIRCGVLCSLGYNYWSKWYEVYGYIFINKSLELFILLLEIHLAYLRISSFSNQKRKQNISLKIRFSIFFIIAFSTCVFSAILSRTITLTGYYDPFNEFNSTSFNFTENNIKNLTPIYKVLVGEKYSLFGYILLVISIFQGVGLLLVLLTVNLIVLFKFRKFLVNKKKMIHSSKYVFFNTIIPV